MAVPNIKFPSYSSSNLFYFLFFVLITLHVVILWCARLYPFVDIPNHLGIATVYRYYNDPLNHFNRMYVLDFSLKPNTFHLFFVSLPLFPSVEFGNKVFFCLYAFVFPLSVLFAIRLFGGNRWFAFLSFLFLYNYNVSYGFVGFTIAVPFLIILVTLLPGYVQFHSLLRGVCCAVLLVALFFMHALAALFAIFVFLVCTVWHATSMPERITKNIPLLPVTALILWWWYNDSRLYGGNGLLSFIIDYYREQYISSLFLRAGLFIFDNYALYQGIPGYLIAAFFSLSAVLIVCFAIVSRKKYPFEKKSRICLSISLIYIVCSGICFLLVPLHLPGYSFLIQRFPVLLFLSMIICGSIYARQHIHIVPRCIAVVIAFIHFFCWADYVVAFNRENASFNESFLLSIDNKSIVTSLIYDETYRGRPIYKQFVDYVIVWRKGIATTRLLDERSFSLRRKGDLWNLPSFVERKNFNNCSSLNQVSYILARNTIPENYDHVLKCFSVEKISGQWKLYRKFKACDCDHE